jgi:GNAT superfamily N-acetyltransferase
MQPVISEGYIPGCIGRIAQLHAAHYARSAGFGLAFEARVAKELAEFCLSHKAGRDGLWLVQGGEIEGSIAIDGSHAAEQGAHLRWFITADSVRGRGLGRQLLGRALDFADRCGYAQVTLWTFAGLDAARHLYESHGFHLQEERPGSQWGKVVDEQRFVRRRP